MHGWIDKMEETMKRDRESEGNLEGGSNPIPSPNKVGDSNDSRTKIQIVQELRLDFVFNEEEEVRKQGQFEDFDMFFNDEESSGSQHSTAKPKKKKKKKVAVSRKEFIDHKSKIDQLLSSVSSQQTP